MTPITDIVQEKSKAIDLTLLQINKEITDAKVPAGKVYFLDKDGNKISDGNSVDKLKVPENTAKIVANGHVSIDGILDNVTVFAQDNVTAKNTMFDSQIIAGGEVKVKGSASGNITAGGNFFTKDTILGNVSAKGSVFAGASHTESQIFAVSDIKIEVSTFGEATAGKNFATKGVIRGSVTAGSSITAKGIQPDAKINSPRLFIPVGAENPKNFAGEINFIPVNEWKNFTPPQPVIKPEPKPEKPESSIKEAFRDFRASVDKNYTDTKNIDYQVAASTKLQTLRDKS